MAETCPEVRIVITTTANREEAEHLGKILVEERLAACATLLPNATSIYRWEGAVATADETLLVLKTQVAKLPALETRLLAMHSYTTPEFLVLPVEAGSSAYLEWLNGSLQG